MAAAGQDVQVSSEPSLLASLLGLALGLSQVLCPLLYPSFCMLRSMPWAGGAVARFPDQFYLVIAQAAQSWRLAGAPALQCVEVTDSFTPSLGSTQMSLQGHDDEDEDVTNPRSAAAHAKPEASGSGVKEGRGEAFCFSANAEAAASAGTASVQQGKLCLSVDGQVWSKAIDLERPAGERQCIA